MHTVTVVLLPPGTKDFWQAGAALLKRHRADDDDPGRRGRLDYWTVGAGTLADPQTAADLGVAGSVDLGENVCLVSRLRPDFVPGAVVTPDGRWFDLEDHGWRLVDGDAPANRAAEAAWAEQAKALFAAHPDHIAVEFDTHS